MSTAKENRAAYRQRKNQTGLCCVYIRHETGFDGLLRPAYDSAPTAKMPLTASEVSTLSSMIARYMVKCRDRRAGKETT